MDFIVEVLGRARTHSESIFSSEEKYQSGVYTPADVEVIPICLTGLAGVGKSQTIAALRKVMPPPADFTSGHFDGVHTLDSYWYSSARGKAGGRQLLIDFLGEDLPEKEHKRMNVAQLLLSCRRKANRDGVSCLLLEEMQHFNAGTGAARVTELLLTMSAIGAPVVYVANYSLLHRLLKRNSEDKQRLLPEQRIMLPDAPGDLAWRGYLDECIRVCNGLINVDYEEFSMEMYRATFGIKRLAAQILKLAYIEARSAGRDRISILDIHRAYLSVGYSANREDVEELNRQAIEKRPTGKRSDLRCPFKLPDSMTSTVVQFSKDDRKNRVNSKVFHSSLSAEERSVFEVLDPLLTSGKSKPEKPAKRKALPKASDDDLASAYHNLLDALDHPSKP